MLRVNYSKAGMERCTASQLNAIHPLDYLSQYLVLYVWKIIKSHESRNNNNKNKNQEKTAICEHGIMNKLSWEFTELLHHLLKVFITAIEQIIWDVVVVL